MTTTRYRLLDRSGGLSRRDLLRGTALAGAAVAAGSFPAPFVHAADPMTLRKPAPASTPSRRSPTRRRRISASPSSTPRWSRMTSSSAR